MMTVITVVFVFLIATLNLAAGYVAAVYLGMGPRSLNEFQRAFARRRPLIMRVPASGAAAAATSNEPLLSNPVESRCLELIRELERFATVASTVDAEIRGLASEAENAEAQAAVQAAATKFADSTHRHLEALNTAIEPLQRASCDDFEFVQGLAQLRASTDLVTVDLNAVVGGALNESHSATGDEKPAAAMKAVGQISEISHHYDATIESSLLRMLTGAVGIEQIARPLFIGNDGLLTYYGAELLFQQMQAAGTLTTAALLDVDHLKRFNADYGGAAGDALFRSVVGKTIESLTGDDRAARINGWQLLLLSPTQSAEELARWVEHLRQVIARTCFQCNGHIARATISAGVSAVASGETAMSLQERLKMTLAEAKSYGRNRTFVCEDEVPAPVVPVELTIAETAVFLV